jgi:hypothetical protein
MIQEVIPYNVFRLDFLKVDNFRNFWSIIFDPVKQSVLISACPVAWPESMVIDGRHLGTRKSFFAIKSRSRTLTGRRDGKPNEAVAAEMHW